MNSENIHDLIDFIDASPSPFHAVQSIKSRLERAGFEQIHEREAWSDVVRPGGKYYVTRNSSTIVAFAVGHKWRPGNPIALMAAHTDSPCLKVKPISRQQSHGYLQVGVECYGGGLWHTWFDRDLGAAGRVIVKLPDGSIEQRLVCIRKPILPIPNLAVHFSTTTAEPFEFNLEEHLRPIAALLNEASVESQPLDAPSLRHHSPLASLIATEAGCELKDVLDFELMLFDSQGAAIAGLNNEFILSARLDNLVMAYCAIEGLIQSLTHQPAADSDGIVRLVGCFDHEETGSESAQGAESNIIPALVRRLSCLQSTTFPHETSDDTARGLSTTFEQTLSRSFLVSADMEHATHPNYSAKTEAQHQVKMNAGVAIKVNANMQYAGSSPGTALLHECALRAKRPDLMAKAQVGVDHGIPLQLSVGRNDQPCGSTLGPPLSAQLGCRAVDVGNAQLGMHSIRETAGTHDVCFATSLFRSFFEHYEELESRIVVD